MFVRMGNPRPHHLVGEVRDPQGQVIVPGELVVYSDDPVVFAQSIALGDGGHGVEMNADVNRYARSLAANTGLVTSLGADAEAFLAVTRTWGHHCEIPPTWVSCAPTDGDDPALVSDFERQISEFYECPRGVPADVEQTHWTDEASPPGVDSGRFAAPTEEPQP